MGMVIIKKIIEKKIAYFFIFDDLDNSWRVQVWKWGKRITGVTLHKDEIYRAVFDYVFPICHKSNFGMSLSIFELLGADAIERNLVSKLGTLYKIERGWLRNM